MLVSPVGLLLDDAGRVLVVVEVGGLVNSSF